MNKKPKRAVRPKASHKARRLVTTYAGKLEDYTVACENSVLTHPGEKERETQEARQKLMEYICSLEQEVILLRAAAK